LSAPGASAAAFRRLHEGPGLFVLPNPYDAGSARLLAGLGFAALATSSGACAGVLGRRDGSVTRQEALAHAGSIVQAVELPVSADLEKGFGDTPDDAAETIRQACAIGLAGGSIEDASGDASRPIYPISQATERIAAAVEAARASGAGFVLTARAENHLHGVSNLDDTILRLQAFERAGADVLFAPALPDLEAVRTVCRSVGKPVNFMAGIRGKSWSLAELEAAGVKRVSVATSLFRAAMSAVLEAGREIREQGTFGYLDRCVTSAEIGRFLR
jgi:2-methylisocitrate lyase-like PEP mutase family enzyme